MIRRIIGYFIDANLLILLAVGDEDPRLIPRHSRLDDYTASDYNVLLDFLRRGRRVLVTQNSLTEASNLLALHGEPQRTQFLRRLRAIILRSEEVVVSSDTASANSAFETYGLTDAALFEVAKPETPVITMDAPLYRAIAAAKGYDSAVNFSAFR